jgi:PhzF family phenazine biosynthesis protein
MEIKLFQIDAFTDKLFGGNPASICPLDHWLPENVMQLIAMENNQAETAFFVRARDRFDIRWFTPATEVDLCGHATLAAAFVIFQSDPARSPILEFDSRSGLLRVMKDGGWFTLDFPADPPLKVSAPDDLIAAMELRPLEAYRGKTDYMLVYSSPEEIETMKPDMGRVARVAARGIIVTAPGRDVDFVSRFFAPQSGIPEDPVTGSAHTTLTPYWVARLGRNDLSARQLSKRGGYLQCRLAEQRVQISGKARAYMAGKIHLDVPVPKKTVQGSR